MIEGLFVSKIAAFGIHTMYNYTYTPYMQNMDHIMIIHLWKLVLTVDICGEWNFLIKPKV